MPEPSAPDPPPGDPVVYRFGSFELDPERYRLTGPDGPVAVEPRVVEVLAYLLRHRDRTVGKEELIDAVWGGQALSDAAVGRAIYQARKAVGDDARNPGVVATVYGRGYRIASGLEVVAAPAAAAREAPPGQGSSRGRPAVGVPRHIVGGALAALVVIAAVAALRWWPGTRDGPSPPATGRTLRLAVVPPSSEDRLGGLAVCDALARRLEECAGTLVRDCAAAAATAARRTSLSEVGSALGADAVVTGYLRGGRLSVELLDLRPDARGAAPWPLDPVPLADPLGPEGGLGEATDRLARALLDRLGAPTPPPVTTVTAPEAAAHALYLRARSQGGVTCAGGGRLDLLAAATGRAPGFVPAWQALAVEHLERASFCGEHRRHYDSALDALAHAAEIGPRSPAAAATAAEALLATGRVEAAYAEIERAERERADPRLDWTAARALLYAGQPGAAEARARRALAGDPDHDLQGWTTGLLAAELPATVRARDDPPGLFARGLVALRAGDIRAAALAVRPAFRADPANLYARLAEALQALAEGSPADTRRIAGEMARARAGVGGGDPVVEYRVGQLLALAGDPAAAASSLERALAGGYVWGPSFDSDPLWDRPRTDPAFGPLLEAAALARSLETAAAELRRPAAVGKNP